MLVSIAVDGVHFAIGKNKLGKFSQSHQVFLLYTVCVCMCMHVVYVCIAMVTSYYYIALRAHSFKSLDVNCL